MENPLNYGVSSNLTLNPSIIAARRGTPRAGIECMKCPFCLAADTKVIDSRGSREGLAIKRRRKCGECGEKFTTFEQIGGPVVVVKRSGARVAFDREKVRSGIVKACSKRPLGERELEEMLARIEARIGQIRSGEVSTEQVGEMVMTELRAFDRVAYVRFASVYRDFQDLSDFRAEIEPLLTTGVGED